MTSEEVQELVKRRGWTADDLAGTFFISLSTAYYWLRRGCKTKAKIAALRASLEQARKRDSEARRAKA